MASAHLTAEQLASYRERRLPAAEVLAVSDHLAECETCRDVLARFGTPMAPRQTASSGEAPISYEEISRLLDDELDPLARREVAEKLRTSAKARAELADLARFGDEMNAEAPRNYDAESRKSHSTIPTFARWALPLAALIAVTTVMIVLSVGSPDFLQRTVTLRDNGRDLVIQSNGQSEALRELPESVRASIAKVVRGQGLKIPPTIASLSGATQTLAGPADGAETASRVLEPVATGVCSAKPHFHWKAVPTASGYRLLVVDEKTGQLVLSENVAANLEAWTPANPLPTGQTYQWSIEALRGNDVIARAPAPPEPEARFAVLPETECSAFAEVERRSGGSHLAVGVAAAEFGLLDEAADEFRILQKENPQSKIPARLLDQVEAKRRRNLVR